jgi:uncharacterized membrane protein
MNFRGNVTGLDRFYAALPYLLPLMTGIPLIFLIANVIPGAGVLLSLFAIVLFLPAMLLSVLGPYGNLIIFFGIYLLVVNNPKIKYFIRYHALQSLLIGIAASLFGLVVSLVPLLPPMIVAVMGLVVGGAVLIASIYSIFCAAMGNYGSIPMISEAVEAQLRYQ